MGADPGRRTGDLVTVRGVTKVFRSPRGLGDVQALASIDLSLRAGEFFAVVGPSGCGKSSLLEIIAGLSQPTSGEVLFDGAPVGDYVPDGIGIIFRRMRASRGSRCARTSRSD